MAAIINQMLPIDGLLVFVSEHDLNDGLFAHKLDNDAVSDDDLIEMVDDTSALNL